MARQATDNPTHFIHSTVITNGLVIKRNTNNIPLQCGMIIIFKKVLCTLRLISFTVLSIICVLFIALIFNFRLLVLLRFLKMYIVSLSNNYLNQWRLMTQLMINKWYIRKNNGIFWTTHSIHQVPKGSIRISCKT